MIVNNSSPLRPLFTEHHVQAGNPSADFAANHQSLSSVPTELYDSAIEAIESEMQSSKELTKWPCAMFRELSKHEQVWCSVLFSDKGGSFIICC